MKHLLILNDPPYGTERSYNALRRAARALAGAWRGLSKGHESHLGD